MDFIYNLKAVQKPFKNMVWRLHVPLIIVIAVMVLELFAVFTNGGYFIGGMTLCAAGLWTLVFIIAYKDQASANIWAGDISRITIMLMAALWLWSGLSILWTLSADLTWNEFNRTGAYLAILIIGIYTGRTHGARRLTAFLFKIGRAHV